MLLNSVTMVRPKVADGRDNITIMTVAGSEAAKDNSKGWSFIFRVQPGAGYISPDCKQYYIAISSITSSEWKTSFRFFGEVL
jgi:hypothetical protein